MDFRALTAVPKPDIHQSPDSGSPHLGMVVEEGLRAVLSPTHAEVVLREALILAGLPELPRRPMALRVFVEGALFAVLGEHLDVGDALEVLSQLRAALSHMVPEMASPPPSSDIRRRGTVPEHPRNVVVATEASLVVFLLQDMLGDDVEILPVSSEAQLLDRLRRSIYPMLLVVDRKHACVGPEVLPGLRDLRPGSAVIWWGGPSHEQLRCESALGTDVSLISTDERMRLADLGELCDSLMKHARS